MGAKLLLVDHQGHTIPVASLSDGPGASDLNRELTGLLCSVGERFDFDSVREYPVKGGRLDVVWTWSPPTSLPGLDAEVPIVGFEIESSWRTRKHVKGDLLNLQDAGVAVGVIVLAGNTDQDRSLRKFATQLVDRPGLKVLTWTAHDVRAFSDQVLSGGLADNPRLQTSNGASDGAAGAISSELASASHAGKYSPLHRWLVTQTRSSLRLTFAELEEVLGFPLPSSCHHHVAHWHSYQGSAVARAIVDAGWKATQVNLGDQTVTLQRLDR